MQDSRRRMPSYIKPHIFLHHNGFWYVTKCRTPFRRRTDSQVKMWDAAYRAVMALNAGRKIPRE